MLKPWVIPLCVKKWSFATGMHLNPQSSSKSLKFFYVLMCFSLEAWLVLYFSKFQEFFDFNYWVKDRKNVKKGKKKSNLSQKVKITLKRCRISSRFRKHIICQHYLKNRRARASVHEQKRTAYSGGRRGYALMLAR